MENTLRRNNIRSTIPVLDDRYLQSLKQKDEVIQNRIEKRNRQQEEVRKLTIESATITLETLIKNKKEIQRRNAVLQNEMRTYVEKFHRDISEVYQADEFLRNTKNATASYLQKNDPEMYEQLKGALDNQTYSMEAKIFNVRNHAPIIINKNNELIRLENNRKQLQSELLQEQNLQDSARTNEILSALQNPSAQLAQKTQQQQQKYNQSENIISEKKQGKDLARIPEGNELGIFKNDYDSESQPIKRMLAGKDQVKPREEEANYVDFDDE